MEVSGAVALVTGGGYGIGRGIAKQLAAAGARIVVDDIHDEHGAETVRMIADAGGQAAHIHGDTTSDDDVQAMFRFAVETFGSLDIVVNNAGGAGDRTVLSERRARELAKGSRLVSHRLHERDAAGR